MCPKHKGKGPAASPILTSGGFAPVAAPPAFKHSLLDSVDLSFANRFKGPTMLRLKKLLETSWNPGKSSGTLPFALEFLLRGYTKERKDAELELIDRYFKLSLDQVGNSKYVSDQSKALLQRLLADINSGIGVSRPVSISDLVGVYTNGVLFVQAPEGLQARAYSQEDRLTAFYAYVAFYLRPNMQLVDQHMELMRQTRQSDAEERSDAKKIFDNTAEDMRVCLGGIVEGIGVQQRIDHLKELLLPEEQPLMEEQRIMQLFAIPNVAMAYQSADRQLLVRAAAEISKTDSEFAVRLLANFDFSEAELDRLGEELGNKGLRSDLHHKIMSGVISNRLNQWIPCRTSESLSDSDFAEHTLAHVNRMPDKFRVSTLAYIIPFLGNRSMAHAFADFYAALPSISPENAANLASRIAERLFSFDASLGFPSLKHERALEVIEGSRISAALGGRGQDEQDIVRPIAELARAQLLSSIMNGIQLVRPRQIISGIYDRSATSKAHIGVEWASYSVSRARKHAKESYSIIKKIYEEANAKSIDDKPELGGEGRLRIASIVFEKTLPHRFSRDYVFPGIPLVYPFTMWSPVLWLKRERLRQQAYGQLMKGLKSESYDSRTNCAKTLGWSGFAEDAVPKEVLAFIARWPTNEEVFYAGGPGAADVRVALQIYAEHLNPGNISYFTELLLMNDERVHRMSKYSPHSRDGKPGPTLTREQYGKLLDALEQYGGGDAALNMCSSLLTLLKYGEKEEFLHRFGLFASRFGPMFGEAPEINSGAEFLMRKLRKDFGGIDAAYLGAAQGPDTPLSSRVGYLAIHKPEPHLLRRMLFSEMEQDGLYGALLIELAALNRLRVLRDIRDFDVCLGNGIESIR